MNTMFNARVLLVDDEIAFLDGLTQQLEAGGLRVCSRTRTKEAVEAAKDKDFDAIILDLALPALDGIETLRQIKTVQPESEIIFLNGIGSARSEVGAMESEAEDFFEKPVDLNKLPEKTHNCLKKRVLILQKRSQQEVGKILQRIWL